MSQIKTYPEMNETIKDLLRRSEEPMQLYILARIEELEKQVSDLTSPPNDPLTILELREMDGKPVWNDTTKEWAIVDTHFRTTINVNGCWRPFSDRYYRRKMEEWENGSA